MNTPACLPRVHILATGGTISAKGADNLKTTGYTASTIGVQSLIEAVPEITLFASSGKGFCISQVRKPASTWPKGIC